MDRRSFLKGLAAAVAASAVSLPVAAGRCGVLYIVFENVSLSEFGNRIPCVTVLGNGYSSPVPAPFVYASHLTEHMDGGIGGGVEYRYSASFAVAVRDDDARGIKQVWLDGKLHHEWFQTNNLQSIIDTA
jgi:hypothetical protein